MRYVLAIDHNCVVLGVVLSIGGSQCRAQSPFNMWFQLVLILGDYGSNERATFSQCRLKEAADSSLVWDNTVECCFDKEQ